MDREVGERRVEERVAHVGHLRARHRAAHGLLIRRDRGGHLRGIGVRHREVRRRDLAPATAAAYSPLHVALAPLAVTSFSICVVLYTLGCAPKPLFCSNVVIANGRDVITIELGIPAYDSVPCAVMKVLDDGEVLRALRVEPMRPRDRELLHAQQLRRAGTVRLMTREAVDGGVLDRVVVVERVRGPARLDRWGLEIGERAVRLARGMEADEEEPQRLRGRIVGDQLDERLAAREREHLVLRVRRVVAERRRCDEGARRDRGHLPQPEALGLTGEGDADVGVEGRIVGRVRHHLQSEQRLELGDRRQRRRRRARAEPGRDHVAVVLRADRAPLGHAGRQAPTADRRNRRRRRRRRRRLRADRSRCLDRTRQRARWRR